MSVGICAVRPGGEREAQRDIERIGFGTRVPTFRVAFYRRGQRYIRVRPLFLGYVFPQLAPGWGDIQALEGVRVIGCLRGRGEERLNDLERHCLLGDFNRAEYRASNGQYEQRRRKRRPRRSKRLRRGH